MLRGNKWSERVFSHRSFRYKPVSLHINAHEHFPLSSKIRLFSNYIFLILFSRQLKYEIIFYWQELFDFKTFVWRYSEKTLEIHISMTLKLMKFQNNPFVLVIYYDHNVRYFVIICLDSTSMLPTNVLFYFAVLHIYTYLFQVHFSIKHGIYQI